ncbi:MULTISPECIES: carbohydrate porin [unclassified Afipia]|uniref:carbohydrate porin n=1 Tax=unclassified Afipia TaxID=2642050 RepID=UPI0004240DC6|nr:MULTISPECIES: carbohydrate porin [unclassified Afipia]
MRYPCALLRTIATASIIFGLLLQGAAAADPKAAPDEPVAKSPRQILADWGIQFNATYISEVFGNASGGMRRGSIYTGRFDFGTDIDLEKAVGWTGAKFHANIFQIHGQGLSRDYIGNLMLVSGVEALRATRLYELWIEQSLFNGAVQVRVGQQASDIEFIDSKYDDIFTNSALGWPGITGINLLSGGPSPPLAVPGVRIKAQLADNITAYAAIFDGDAAPPDRLVDPQIANPHGLLFRVTDPAWMIGQLKYGFQLGENSLPGTLTGGAWKHLGEFGDMRYAMGGFLQADPLGSGVPLKRRGNHGVFGVYEQMLSRAAPGSDKGVGFFLRTAMSPSDRNLINFYVDGGFQFTGFSDARPNDKFGVGMTYARISDAARAADRDVQVFIGAPFPIRDFEAVFEMTYVAEIQTGWTVQPVFQYVLHPGGGVVDPNDPTQTKRIKDAAVFGLRSTFNY